MKIAICDDELSSIQEIRSLLTHWAVRHDLSFTLYQYSNGDDLLLALKHTSMDLIILDIIMPLLNGWIQPESLEVRVLLFHLSF